MELRISAKNLNLSDRFREYVAEKSSKVSQLSHKPEELNIKVTRYEHNRNAGVEDQVELTVYQPGHVVRAEARAEDKFAAFDVAFGKLIERLRRYSDKQKVHRGGGHKNLGVSELAATDFAAIDLIPADLSLLTGEVEVIKEDEPPLDLGKSPIEFRSKTFDAVPMSKTEAVDSMELVGHDFYFYHDSDTNQPSVLYRRKGWSYGVITLS